MEKLEKIEWEPALEPAQYIEEDPETQGLILRMRLEKGRAVPDSAYQPRKDRQHSNMERQGIWADLSSRCEHPLLHNPGLAACIHIDPLKNVLNPDSDIEPIGEFLIFGSPDAPTEGHV